MKRVPQLTTFSWGTRCHHIYHWMKLIQISSCSLRISRVWRCLYQSIRRYYSGSGLDNSSHRQNLLWGDSVESWFGHTTEYITHCRKNRIVFSPDKFHFGENVEFTGFLIRADGVKLLKKMTTASFIFLPTQISLVTGPDLGLGILCILSSVGDGHVPRIAALKKQKVLFGRNAWPIFWGI